MSACCGNCKFWNGEICLNLDESMEYDGWCGAYESGSITITAAALDSFRHDKDVVDITQEDLL